MMRLLLLFALIFLLNSCVSYRAQYADNNAKDVLFEDSSESSIYTIYFVGDAGNAPPGGTTKLLRYLKTKLEQETRHSCIVWLGDNIYPVGLAPEGHPDHALGKHRLMKELEVHEKYMGKVFFVPGNHDWYEYGKEGVLRQEEVVEKYLSERTVHDPDFQNNYFLPDSTIPKVNMIDLSDGISMLLIDSAWFLSQSEKEDDETKESESSRREFLEEISQTIGKYKDNTIVVAMHHPFYTYGSHGGKFKFKDYMFPLSQLNKALLIPLPFSGIIVNKMRTYISEQDNKHSLYKLLMNHIESELVQSGSSLIAAGHEHNLQYIELKNNFHVISGSGSKKNPCTLGEGSEFCMGENGFAKLEFQNKIDARITYFVLDKSSLSETIVFSKKVKFKN